jgi:hypothetical protein
METLSIINYNLYHFEADICPITNRSFLFIGLYMTLMFQKVKDPIISRQSAREIGKFVSPSHRLPLPPGDNSGSQSYYKLGQPQDHNAAERVMPI